MLMTKYARYIKSEQIKAIDFDPFGLNLGTIKNGSGGIA